MAKKQKRNCFLISFSVRARTIDLAKPGAWKKLETFLNDRYSGGTDGDNCGCPDGAVVEMDI
jgi:uncharacterized protein with von Willebrand factor type A (vWA) domain